MKTRIYKAPKVWVYPTKEEFFHHVDNVRRWRRNGCHIYTAPSINLFSSWKEKNMKALGEVASQQARDEMSIIILGALFSAKFLPKGWMAEVNDANGVVEVILYYHLGEFVSLCLREKEARACTFDSFLNWALQKGRGIQEVTYKDWRRNCAKACRKLWNQLPKALKKGSKVSNDSILYSTKKGIGMGVDEVGKYIEKRVQFFKERGLKKLALEAATDASYILTSGTSNRREWVRYNYGI